MPRLALDIRKKERASNLRYAYNITDALGSAYTALVYSTSIAITTSSRIQKNHGIVRTSPCRRKDVTLVSKP